MDTRGQNVMDDDGLEPLVTECPDCKTRFRVAEAQLSTARGRVRCGNCLAVFIAANHFVFDPDDAPTTTGEDPNASLDALLDELAAASDRDRPEHPLSPRSDAPPTPDASGSAAPAGTGQPGPAPDAAAVPEPVAQAQPDTSSGRIDDDAVIDSHVDEGVDDDVDEQIEITALPADADYTSFGVTASDAPRQTDAVTQAATMCDRQELAPGATDNVNASDTATDNDSKRDCALAATEVSDDAFDALVGATFAELRGEETADATAAHERASATTAPPQKSAPHAAEASPPRAPTGQSALTEAPPAARPQTAHAAPASSTSKGATDAPGVASSASATTTASNASDATTGNSDATAGTPPWLSAKLGPSHDELERELLKPAARPRLRLRWIGAAAVASVLMVAAQALWFQYDDWSRSPTLRPYYESLCGVVGCTLQDMRALDQVRSQNLVVRSHTDDPRLLQVDAVIINEAVFEQPFPTIEMRFSAIGGQLVSAQRFRPADYLAGELTGERMMPPQTPVRIAVEVRDPGIDAVNYVLVFR